MDALGQGKYSVGPPYFNAVFVPAMALLAPFMAVGPISRWKQDSSKRWLSELGVPAIVCILVAIAAPLVGVGEVNVWASLSVLLAAWLVLGLVRDLQARMRGVSSGSALFARLTPSYLGMLMAHFGFALTLIGATFVTQFSAERDLRMEVGDTVTLNGYAFVLDELTVVEGPNYAADRGIFSVSVDDNCLRRSCPRKALCCQWADHDRGGYRRGRYARSLHRAWRAVGRWCLVCARATQTTRSLDMVWCTDDWCWRIDYEFRSSVSTRPALPAASRS